MNNIICIGLCPNSECNNGICSLGTCKCNSGWSGPTCDHQLIAPNFIPPPSATISEGTPYVSPPPQFIEVIRRRYLFF